ncbi:MAG: ATP-binding protein [Bacteroidales bacterium]|nr:ATP-binding protein [Bacteroidales bacterium]
MIERKLQKVIKDRFFNGKAIVLIGARQVGKTTLLQELTNGANNILWLNGDELATRTLLQEVSVEKFRSLIGSKKIMVVDEAQRIENIGLKMKLITDHLPEVQLILTGSSSFELANRVNEPLTGRNWEYTLFPLSFAEMAEHTNAFDEIKHLSLRLVYGYYPDVVTHPGDEKEVLKQITDSYLYKDILEWGRVKKSDKLVKLLQSLAFQVGSEVSLTELGQQVDLDKNTVEKYIVLLEQAQVIFRLGSLSRNLRNELKTARKIYFYDNGVRNALINNFNDLALRDDTGALWENWMISELVKKRSYDRQFVNRYFWRTTQQQEIDYIEEADGHFTAYEFKWNPKKKAKISQTFLKAYPNTEMLTVNPDNFYTLLL